LSGGYDLYERLLELGVSATLCLLLLPEALSALAVSDPTRAIASKRQTLRQPRFSVPLLIVQIHHVLHNVHVNSLANLHETANAEIMAMRLREVYDRVEGCRERYWNIPHVGNAAAPIYPKWKYGLDSWCPLKTRRGTPPDYSGQPYPELLSKCRENALTRNSPEPGIVPKTMPPDFLLDPGPVGGKLDVILHHFCELLT
jgi:hypothetical protein